MIASKHNNPTERNRMKTLSSIALIAALTLSAQARDPNLFGSVTDGPTYLYDDGTSEYAWSNVSHGHLAEAIWFNQFTAVPGAQTIVSVDIAWGTLSNSTPAKRLNGIPVTIGIWSDPNDDANPSDAVLVGAISGTIEHANTDTFVTYTFPTSVTIYGKSFFVGYMSPGSNGLSDSLSKTPLLFGAQDTTSPVGKSWLATMNGLPVDFVHIGRNRSVKTTEQLGSPGNWMIRATGDGPTY